MFSLRNVSVLTVLFCLFAPSSVPQSTPGNGNKKSTGGDTTDSKPAQTPGAAAPASISAQSYALAYNGLHGDSYKIAERILLNIGAAAATKKIVILDRSTIDDLAALQVAKLEINFLSQQLCYIRNPPPGAAAGGADPLSGISSIISATATLLQVLSPSSTSTNADIKIADEMLESEVAGALQLKGYSVYLPRVYLPTPQLMVAALNDVSGGCPYQPSDNLAIAYDRLMISYVETQVLLTGSTLSEGQKTALKTLLSRIDRFRNDIEGSQSQPSPKATPPVDPTKADPTKGQNTSDMSKTDTASVASTPAPLLRLIRVQAFWEDDLEGCVEKRDSKEKSNTKTDVCYILYLHIGQAAGGTITRKWVFHPDWYYYSGGSIASFSLLSFSTGKVLASGVYTTVTNYMKEDQFKGEYNAKHRFVDAGVDERKIETAP